MKSKIALLLFILPVAATQATPKSAPVPTTETAQDAAASPAVILAGQVHEIASSTDLSRKAQAKLIAEAVKVAVTAATDGIKDPAERLQLAADLAAAAAKAAPQFAATITKAISTLPFINGIPGAADEIQGAVSKAIEASDDAGIANPAANPPRPPANPEFGGPNKGETVVSPSH